MVLLLEALIFRLHTLVSSLCRVTQEEDYNFMEVQSVTCFHLCKSLSESLHLVLRHPTFDWKLQHGYIVQRSMKPMFVALQTWALFWRSKLFIWKCWVKHLGQGTLLPSLEIQHSLREKNSNLTKIGTTKMLITCGSGLHFCLDFVQQEPLPLPITLPLEMYRSQSLVLCKLKPWRKKSRLQPPNASMYANIESGRPVTYMHLSKLFICQKPVPLWMQ